ncbi:FAD/NAD(P)-binding protein [Jeotgalibaca caeni]|uniref:FAD/NAD(P)-binding protein n=1 Tax=Jeotgalibaca caeni TaxID=3028623 RepID=UPI00237DE018|nr:FAD/NAD(P)-binding protein [Jeotgalibaca caeni]MDE1549708.1 FAD/NAD(P)-binding protein [Jeotgalibaca caeni]
MKIAIVGAGLSGSNVLKTILTHPNFQENDQIDVFEPLEKLGPGFPYAPDDESIMLNNSVTYLSVDLRNPMDFVEWLEQKYGSYENTEGLVSRQRYGQYLSEHFEPYYAHPQVTAMHEEVVDMEVNGKQYRLKTQDGWLDTLYDVVYFAIGHQPYKDYYKLDGTKNYVQNPYPASKNLNQFSNEQRIGVIGTGTTSVDMMRYFTQHYDLKHPLTYYDRDMGFYFPAVPYTGGPYNFSFSDDWIDIQKEKHDSFIPFEIILETLRADLQLEGVDIREVYETYKENDLNAKIKAVESKDQKLALTQAYISRLGHFLPSLFQAMSPVNRAHYLSSYYPKLIFFRSLVPNKSFKRLADLYKNGKIRVVFGITDIETQADGTFLVKADQTETVDVLVNATGFETNLEKAGERSELIRNLYKKGLIMPQANGQFVLVDWPRSRVMNEQYGVMDGVYMLGSHIRGIQHENNDAKIITQQAVKVATWMMDELVLAEQV